MKKRQIGCAQNGLLSSKIGTPTYFLLFFLILTLSDGKKVDDSLFWVVFFVVSYRQFCCYGGVPVGG
jgi:hypothetical protein